MRKVLSLFVFIFLAWPLFAAEDWAVLKNNISSNKVLKALISPNGRVSYCIDGTQTQIIPDIEKIFQMWFDNVLSYRNIYPNFDETFKEILPILERKNKMALQQCATPFYLQNAKGEELKGFISQKIGYKFAQNKPLLRISFCYKSECLAPNVGGFCELENIPEKKVIAALDAKNIVVSLAHELGHTLSIGDVLYGKENNDYVFGYHNLSTIMYTHEGFTCDDADSVVALLYMAMEKPKTFYSFCGDRVFENGEKKTFKFLKNSFSKDSKKYEKLENLNRVYDKPIREMAADFNTRMLKFKLQQDPDYIKNMKNLL